MSRMEGPGQVPWTRHGVSSEGCKHLGATATSQGQSPLRKWEAGESTRGKVQRCTVHMQWYPEQGKVGGGRGLCPLTPQEGRSGAPGNTVSLTCPSDRPR